MEFNPWSYKIQDSLTKYLKARDPEEYNYCVVPMDSIEAVLAQMNIDPTSPEYESDMWKAVEQLKCSRVIMGNFNVRGGKFLINCYIYIVDYKLADPRYQVKDIFKDMDKIYEVVSRNRRKTSTCFIRKNTVRRA